ncbi:unnamed protein product [Albugo candida]|nr:unnamed protein product [Albugo candida]|eukprot:CCI46217.1 unnamed protein product [Albugo candida]
MAQLGTSVLGGLITELALVGWSGSKVGIRRVWNDGLKDIVVLGIIRVATILFGLTALKYINVSFTQTIKSSGPFFTVILTYVLLGQRTGWRVNASLFPIVLGLVMCSLSDASFHVVGFVAALLANCADCIQNVLSKKLMNRSYTASQLQLYTSVIAAALQISCVLYNEEASTRSQSLAFYKSNNFLHLFLAGLAFYSQSVFAYAFMSLVSPVTHSVTNCVKRTFLITLSIYRFGEDVTFLNWAGILLVTFGVYSYSIATKFEQTTITTLRIKSENGLKSRDTLGTDIKSSTTSFNHQEVKIV